jgi:hypothetical protein
LYVIALHARKPQLMAWLEAGSRAWKGLREVSVDYGNLVVAVNDPEKQQGECWSSGSITTRYQWREGAFHQIGEPVLADDP